MMQMKSIKQRQDGEELGENSVGSSRLGVGGVRGGGGNVFRKLNVHRRRLKNQIGHSLGTRFRKNKEEFKVKKASIKDEEILLDFPSREGVRPVSRFVSESESDGDQYHIRKVTHISDEEEDYDHFEYQDENQTNLDFDDDNVDGDPYLGFPGELDDFSKHQQSNQQSKPPQQNPQGMQSEPGFVGQDLPPLLYDSGHDTDSELRELEASLLLNHFSTGEEEDLTAETEESTRHSAHSGANSNLGTIQEDSSHSNDHIGNSANDEHLTDESWRPDRDDNDNHDDQEISIEKRRGHPCFHDEKKDDYYCSPRLADVHSPKRGQTLEKCSPSSTRPRDAGRYLPPSQFKHMRDPARGRQQVSAEEWYENRMPSSLSTSSSLRQLMEPDEEPKVSAKSRSKRHSMTHDNRNRSAVSERKTASPNKGRTSDRYDSDLSTDDDLSRRGELSRPNGAIPRRRSDTTTDDDVSGSTKRRGSEYTSTDDEDVSGLAKSEGRAHSFADDERSLPLRRKDSTELSSRLMSRKQSSTQSSSLVSSPKRIIPPKGRKEPSSRCAKATEQDQPKEIALVSSSFQEAQERSFAASYEGKSSRSRDRSPIKKSSEDRMSRSQDKSSIRSSLHEKNSSHGRCPTRTASGDRNSKSRDRPPARTSSNDATPRSQDRSPTRRFSNDRNLSNRSKTTERVLSGDRNSRSRDNSTRRSSDELSQRSRDRAPVSRANRRTSKDRDKSPSRSSGMKSSTDLGRAEKGSTGQRHSDRQFEILTNGKESYSTHSRASSESHPSSRHSPTERNRSERRLSNESSRANRKSPKRSHVGSRSDNRRENSSHRSSTASKTLEVPPSQTATNGVSNGRGQESRRLNGSISTNDRETSLYGAKKNKGSRSGESSLRGSSNSTRVTSSRRIPSSSAIENRSARSGESSRRSHSARGTSRLDVSNADRSSRSTRSHGSSMSSISTRSVERKSRMDDPSPQNTRRPRLSSTVSRVSSKSSRSAAAARRHAPTRTSGKSKTVSKPAKVLSSSGVAARANRSSREFVEVDESKSLKDILETDQNAELQRRRRRAPKLFTEDKMSMVSSPCLPEGQEFSFSRLGDSRRDTFRSSGTASKQGEDPFANGFDFATEQSKKIGHRSFDEIEADARLWSRRSSSGGNDSRED